MAENKDEIGEILADFKEKKERQEHSVIEPLAPPVRRENYIDFAKREEGAEISEKKKSRKEKKPAPTPEEKQAKKEERRQKTKQCLEKIKKVLFNKVTLIAVVVIALGVAGYFGISAVSEASKTAYLKPYQDKYPDVNFPQGIMETYCDIFGQNPDSQGYIEIEDIQLESPVFSKESKKYPMGEDCLDGAQVQNFVVYLNDNSLENLYKDPESYNSDSTSGFIKYSDYCQEYTFKVVGAFYINTDEKDDNGYIFPYNVTEKMTEKSSNNYISGINNRMLYSTGVTLTRQDKLLILSCDTDYRENFRFVVVAALSSDNDLKSTAAEKSNPWYPQVICDEMGIENIYRLTSKWYPEIIVKDSDGKESTVQQTIDDYKQ